MACVQILATGSGKCADSLSKASQLLDQWHLSAMIPPDLFGDHPLYSQSHSLRLRNLQNALTCPESQWLWALRGGCGTTRLLPDLFQMPRPQSEKRIIGLSDLTALLIFVAQEWGWQPIHGATLRYVSQDVVTPEIKKLMKDLVSRKLSHLSYDDLVPLNDLAKQEITLTAPITGGNLTLLQASIGTPWQVQTAGKIVFIEDINEEPYRTAERLEHLRQAGLFERATALLFGDFSQESPTPNFSELMDFVIQDFAKTLNIPCLGNLPVGHFPHTSPIIIHLESTITLGKKGELFQDLTQWCARGDSNL